MGETYPPKWEYTSVTWLVNSGPSLLDVLNDYGRDGWEAVSYTEKPSHVWVLLKRPVWPPTVTTEMRAW